MKTMKKILALLLTAALCLTMALPVFAEGSSATGSITIEYAVKNQVYNAYKIFDVVYNDSGNYAYSIKDNNKFYSAISVFALNAENGMTLTLQFGSTDTYNVTVDTTKFNEAKAGVLAAALNKVVDKGNPTATGTGIESDGKVTCTISGLDDGYYFVDTTTGTLCSLGTVADTVVIQDKNTAPTIDKKVKNKNVPNDNYADENTATIGDPLEFQITITAGKGAQNYVLHDKMTTGFTFNNANNVTVKYKKKGNTGDPVNCSINDDYVLTDPITDACNFEIKIKKELNEGDQIIVTYTATFNANAVISYETLTENRNTNTATLYYGEKNDLSVKDDVFVDSYMFDLVKTDNSEANEKVLTGAKFKLYDAEKAGNEIKVEKETTETEKDEYKVNNSASADTEIEAGVATIRGLRKGTYYLEETTAPQDYNKLTSRVPVEITGASLQATVTESEGIQTYTNGGIQVENKSGAELPSTGGMGTTIFYIVGSVLAVGAGVLLVVKRRMRDEER